MSALGSILRSAEGGVLLFRCPGCGMPHQVRHGAGSGPRWAWNGDAASPTFSPSIRVRYDLWMPSAENEEIAAKIRTGEIVQTKVERICHSFVRDGRIEFLGDCTHALAGLTVPLQPWDAEA